MSAAWTVEANPAQIADVQALLANVEKGYNRAVQRAANYASDRTKTEIVRKLKALLTADPDTIQNSLRKTRALLASPTAKLTLNPTGGSVRLFLYDWTAQVPTTKGGVSVQIFKAGPPLLLKHAFIAKMQSGHRGVFMREGPKRKMGRGNYADEYKQPIVEKFGPHMARIFEQTPGIEQALLEFGAEKFAGELMRQAELLYKQEYGVDPPDDWAD